MHDDNEARPNVVAAVIGITFGFLAFAAFWFLSTLSAPPPSVRWVKLQAPVELKYVSYIPCIRTSGWVLPVVECYADQSRTAVSAGEDPPPTDCKLRLPVPNHRPEC